MFGPHSEYPLFYDKKQRILNIEREFGNRLPLGLFRTPRRDADRKRFEQAESARRWHWLAQTRAQVGHLRLRLEGWLAEVECRLRGRVLREPCAEGVTLR